MVFKAKTGAVGSLRKLSKDRDPELLEKGLSISYLREFLIFSLAHKDLGTRELSTEELSTQDL